MAQLQPYKTTSDLNKGSMVRIDDNLFIAIMALGQKQNNTELLTYTPIVRAILSAVCIDKTFVHISETGGIQAGITYYTESDIKVSSSQIETLQNQGSEYARELANKDATIKNMSVVHQQEIARLRGELQMYSMAQIEGSSSILVKGFGNNRNSSI